MLQYSSVVCSHLPCEQGKGPALLECHPYTFPSGVCHLQAAILSDSDCALTETAHQYRLCVAPHDVFREPNWIADIHSSHWKRRVVSQWRLEDLPGQATQVSCHCSDAKLKASANWVSFTATTVRIPCCKRHTGVEPLTHVCSQDSVQCRNFKITCGSQAAGADLGDQQ